MCGISTSSPCPFGGKITRPSTLLSILCSARAPLPPLLSYRRIPRAAIGSTTGASPLLDPTVPVAGSTPPAPDTAVARASLPGARFLCFASPEAKMPTTASSPSDPMRPCRISPSETPCRQICSPRRRIHTAALVRRFPWATRACLLCSAPVLRRLKPGHAEARRRRRRLHGAAQACLHRRSLAPLFRCCSNSAADGVRICPPIVPPDGLPRRLLCHPSADLVAAGATPFGATGSILVGHALLSLFLASTAAAPASGRRHCPYLGTPSSLLPRAVAAAPASVCRPGLGTLSPLLPRTSAAAPPSDGRCGLGQSSPSLPLSRAATSGVL